MTTAKEFAALQREWDKKLRASGFDDIEVIAGKRSQFLRRPPGYIAKQYDPATDVYYTRCRQFTHDHTFSNFTDKHVWTLYAEGKSYREIVRYINDFGVFLPGYIDTARDLSVTGVYKIVNRLIADMNTYFAAQAPDISLPEVEC